MKILNSAATLLIGFLSVGFAAAAQESHDHMKGMETPTKQTEKKSAKSAPGWFANGMAAPTLSP